MGTLYILNVFRFEYPFLYFIWCNICKKQFYFQNLCPLQCISTYYLPIHYIHVHYKSSLPASRDIQNLLYKEIKAKHNDRVVGNRTSCEKHGTPLKE